MLPDITNETGSSTSGNSMQTAEEYRIRTMKESDLDDVYAIEVGTWGEDSWPLSNLYDACCDPRNHCWILETTTGLHSIAGYGLQYDNDQSEDASHIANLTIHPAHRGRGLGGLLLRHMIRHADQMLAMRVILEVSVANALAFNLYSKHGFAIVEFLDRYYGKRGDGYRMELAF